MKVQTRISVLVGVLLRVLDANSFSTVAAWKTLVRTWVQYAKQAEAILKMGNIRVSKEALLAEHVERGVRFFIQAARNEELQQLREELEKITT